MAPGSPLPCTVPSVISLAPYPTESGAERNDGTTRHDEYPRVPVPVDFFSCFLASDSASGNIAHHMAQHWSSMSPNRGNNTLRLAGAILIQLLFSREEQMAADLELANVCSSLTLEGVDYCWREFLPKGATWDHVAACVRCRYLESSPPPVMVVIGGFDPLKDRHVNYVELLPHHLPWDF
ncbi:hypothetical protein EJB05_30672, partial [Eragrostis curvula]